MIKLERNRNNYFVIANNKILLVTKDLSYANEVLNCAKNNDLTYASRTFVPAIRPDPIAEH